MSKDKEPLGNRILSWAHVQPEGTPVTAERLSGLGNRAAIDQALSRLTKQGLLLRVCRGVYLSQVEGKFGKRWPADYLAAKGLAKLSGEQLVGTEAAAANALGLTNQIPLRLTYLTSGPTRCLRIGHQVVDLRHAPRWKWSLGNSKPGLVIRAIAWLGPENAREAISHLRQRLSSEERMQLASAGRGMPNWVARAVFEVANG